MLKRGQSSCEVQARLWTDFGGIFLEPVHDLPQLCDVGSSARCELTRLHLCEIALEFGIALRRQQHSAHSVDVGRHARANLHGNGVDVARRYARDVDQVGAVEHA